MNCCFSFLVYGLSCHYPVIYAKVLTFIVFRLWFIVSITQCFQLKKEGLSCRYPVIYAKVLMFMVYRLWYLCSVYPDEKQETRIFCLDIPLAKFKGGINLILFKVIKQKK